MARTRPILDRFMERHESTADGCWRWIGAFTPAGYPKLGHNYSTVAMHRWSYEHFMGPIADGLVVDHLCRNPWCVNPHHMEPVTIAENTRRGNAWTSPNRPQPWSACRNGHPLVESNVYRNARGRQCRTCRNAAKRAARSRRRQNLPLRGESAPTKR